MLENLSIDQIRQRGSIRDSDVARLRVGLAASDVMPVEIADALFSLHAACPIQDPSWSPFLVDTMTDYVVNQAEPAGYVVAENARWLIAHIGTYGRVETSTELAMLVHILETARWTPPSLASFGLAQIRYAVETGTGPLRAGRGCAPGTITPEEVDLAARLIATFGGETNIPVTRAEADALIAINRAITAGNSTPAWSSLFVRTVGTAVLAALGHVVQSRRELLDDASIRNGSSALLSLFAETPAAAGEVASDAESAAFGIWASSPILTHEERALARLERQRLEIVTNEVIEEATDVWLMTRLGEVSPPAPNEAALLAFVARQAHDLTPELAAFTARISKAA